MEFLSLIPFIKPKLQERESAHPSKITISVIYHVSENNILPKDGSKYSITSNEARSESL
jgi:hypothetical protein